MLKYSYKVFLSPKACKVTASPVTYKQVRQDLTHNHRSQMTNTEARDAINRQRQTLDQIADIIRNPNLNNTQAIARIAEIIRDTGR